MQAYLRTRVKICGITRIADALEAVRLGADALGFVFYDRSSRRLGVEQACEIASQLPPFVARIALFLDAESEYVDAVISRFKPDVLQFHGNESPGFCAAFGVPYIKSVPMGSKLSIQDYSARYPGACAVLLDSHTPGAAGGSGQRFDWKRVPRELKKPFILAGGLAPDNVTDALRQVRPFAVDVSSGVEAAPGVKDHALMADFMKEVANGDQA
jgi:phosphoribosylanthranilate isomerase